MHLLGKTPKLQFNYVACKIQCKSFQYSGWFKHHHWYMHLISGLMIKVWSWGQFLAHDSEAISSHCTGAKLRFAIACRILKPLHSSKRTWNLIHKSILIISAIWSDQTIMIKIFISISGAVEVCKPINECLYNIGSQLGTTRAIVPPSYILPAI